MVKPSLHIDGYEIHRKAQRIPYQLLLELKKQAGKASVIFNNVKGIRGNDRKRQQAFLNASISSVKSFMRSLFSISLKRHPKLIPNSFVVLKSLAGCKSQLPHCDYVQNESFNPSTDGDVPLGCIVAIEDNTTLDVWPKSINLSNADQDSLVENPDLPIEKVQLQLKKGDVLFFRGDLVHAGSSYDKTNHRVHFFLDNPSIKRPSNNTWFSNAWWIIR